MFSREAMVLNQGNPNEELYREPSSCSILSRHGNKFFIDEGVGSGQCIPGHRGIHHLDPYFYSLLAEQFDIKMRIRRNNI